MKKLFALLSLAFIVHMANAQENSSENPLKISGYLETYYGYDFGNPPDHNRPDFLYSFNRHNEVNLNLGFIQAAYDDGKVRGKLALMTGTYTNANLAAEPGVLKNIFEANAGVKISKTKNLWVDAGIFASHIGFESAIGANCWNMTRSILAENSPYFLSGAKISYTSDNEKWFVSGLLLNGWQRIQRVEGNQTPAFGHQVTFTPTDKVTLNSSSFIGSDTPDSDRQMRYFHNFYGQFQLSERFGLITGFDIGAQQTAKGSREYHVWYSPVVIARIAATDKLAFAARAEYYSDKGEVIISTDTPNGFQTFGYSLNMDLQITENVLWRLEARTFNSQNDAIFQDSNQVPTQNNGYFGTALSIGF
ncbi:porin [Algoriphagus litoralis]|uniref:porin n=1 Tax=Algoriphagus litoralis TaxID=2202829 RepID=UPI000DBA1216|nr:porin [Algoriphagus litoralis]